VVINSLPVLFKNPTKQFISDCQEGITHCIETAVSMAVSGETAMDILHQLIDDFGTGYPSLMYLKKLPVDEDLAQSTFLFSALSVIIR